MRNRTLYGLVYLAAIVSLGNYIDHATRGNHVGWLLTERNFEALHITPIVDQKPMLNRTKGEDAL